MRVGGWMSGWNKVDTAPCGTQEEGRTNGDAHGGGDGEEAKHYGVLFSFQVCFQDARRKARAFKELMDGDGHEQGAGVADGAGGGAQANANEDRVENNADLSNHINELKGEYKERGKIPFNTIQSLPSSYYLHKVRYGQTVLLKSRHHVGCVVMPPALVGV